MKNLKILVSLVALFALVVFMTANVVAFGSITSVEVDGVEALGGAELSTFAGNTVPVKVVFKATDNVEDVTIQADISGHNGDRDETSRFDVIAGKTYVKYLTLTLPFDIDPDEEFNLDIEVDSRNDGKVTEAIVLTVERESYLVQVLDVVAQPEVTAGDNLVLDIVLKNRGRQDAEDNFVSVRIPALGVEDRSYFGDLTPTDEFDPDKDDAVERRMYVNIPNSAPAGVYIVEIEAFNDDSSAVVTKKVAIVGASANSIVVPSTNSRTFGVGDTGEYSITIVNSGNRVRVYEIVLETSSGLTLESSEPIVAVPAGTSKSVIIGASSNEAGKYNFAVVVNSDSVLVKRESFTANVEGRSGFTGTGSNITVLLTVILAIIFIILIIVLIVLLARKPEEKSEEFGESYY